MSSNVDSLLHPGAEGSVLDFTKSFMVMEPQHSANQWQTGIQCINLDHRSDKYAYLAEECRAEGVDVDQIFSDRHYEYCCVKGYEKNFLLRHGAYHFGFRNKKPKSIYEETSIDIRTVPFHARASVLSFSDLLSLVHKGETGHIFLQATVTYKGIKQTIISPCRYLNYSRAGNDENWIQPCSGYILTYDGERFKVGYIACYWNEDTQHIELLHRRAVGILDTKPKTSRLRKLLAPLAPLLNRLFIIDEFVEYETVEGAVVFFKYD